MGQGKRRVEATKIRGERVVDRTGWPSGPWDDEPDRVEGEFLGFPCLVRRASLSGALCGYVAVPPGHPAHGREGAAIGLLVHGGVNYSGRCEGPICHEPKPGAPDNVWWFGFDCSHAGDFMPGFAAYELSDPGEYKDLAYVTANCFLLAKQLHELADD